VSLRPRTLLIASLALAAPSIAGATSKAEPLVPTGAYLVADESGHLLVLDQRGKVLRRVPRFTSYVQALDTGPDRRHAFVSVFVRDQPPRLYKVDLASGMRLRVANATSPSLSPDRRELAYVTVETRDDIKFRTALAIRNLVTAETRLIALPPRTPLGTPPELVINWSPDARHVAIFDGTLIRIVDVATARTVESQSPIPGGTGFAPVFLDSQRLLVQATCCIGRHQRLAVVNLRSGVRSAFAVAGSPVENVRRLSSRAVLVVTALHRLVRFSPGRARVLARRIVAATS
jgi:hypothetical protein